MNGQAEMYACTGCITFDQTIFKKLLVHRGVKIDLKVIFPFDEADNAAFETVKELLDQVSLAYKGME